MNEEAFSLDCGAKECGHRFCPFCKSTVPDEYAEDRFAMDQGYQELGGEA